MREEGYRTIEDRLEHIESEVHQIKFMLAELFSKKPIQEDKQEDQFMTVKEVAQFLKVDPIKIYSACSKGEIRFIKLGKLYKFKKEDVLRWVQKSKTLPQIDVDDYVEKYLQKNILKG